MEVKERVMLWLENLKEKGISQASMAKKIGKTRGYINGMAKGKTSIGSSAINHIMQIDPELNRDWLLFGEGEMYLRIRSKYSEVNSKSELNEDYKLNEMSKDDHIQSLKERIGELHKQLGVKDDQIKFLQHLIEKK